MPNYKNGANAKVGDWVRGTTINSGGRMVVGTIVSVTTGAEPANCQVAYLEVMSAKELTSYQTGHFIRASKGEEYLAIVKADFADTKGLERISEPLLKAEPLKARAAGR